MDLRDRDSRIICKVFGCLYVIIFEKKKTICSRRAKLLKSIIEGSKLRDPTTQKLTTKASYNSRILSCLISNLAMLREVVAFFASFLVVFMYT